MVEVFSWVFVDFLLCCSVLRPDFLFLWSLLVLLSMFCLLFSSSVGVSVFYVGFLYGGDLRETKEVRELWGR